MKRIALYAFCIGLAAGSTALFVRWSAAGSKLQPAPSPTATRSDERPGAEAPGSLGVETQGRGTQGGERTNGQDAATLNDLYGSHFREMNGLSYSALRRYRRTAYLPAHALDVTRAEFYKKFVKRFRLSPRAQTILKQKGFVVVPIHAKAARKMGIVQGAGPADIYYRVFHADLPVYVSADSILHAWHRSFDEILKHVETSHLRPTLQILLVRSLDRLDPKKPDERDASVYLAVARSLLSPGWRPPASLREEVHRIRRYISRQRPARVTLFGATTLMDFSQLKPRGHYAESWSLRTYFRAMMWLGRTDLVLYRNGEAPSVAARTERAARALARALRASRSEELYGRIDRFYRAVVGQSNAITPLGLLALCDRAGRPGCTGDGAPLRPLYAAQRGPAYSSRLFAADRSAITLRFFPQRFAYDAWALSRATTPLLAPATRGGRSMASVLDAGYLLGSNRALHHLASDMALPGRQNLPAALEAARSIIHTVRPTVVDDSVYNHWLEGLMALSEPDVRETLPQVLRTASWHDRKLEAVLGSWAELRHDTVLIVEQSTGGGGCQYPRGFIEPVPGLFHSLARSAKRLESALGSSRVEQQVRSYLTHWQAKMARLARMAADELAGRPLRRADLKFMNHAVDLHRESYGDRMYDGWYPTLYWSRGWTAKPKSHIAGGLSKPIVADVHNDADGGKVLQVGVGNPALMIVALDVGGKTALYAGPVYSFYAFHQPLAKRLSDNEWQARVWGRKLPPHPPFAAGYWAE